MLPSRPSAPGSTSSQPVELSSTSTPTRRHHVSDRCRLNEHTPANYDLFDPTNNSRSQLPNPQSNNASVEARGFGRSASNRSSNPASNARQSLVNNPSRTQPSSSSGGLTLYSARSHIVVEDDDDEDYQLALRLQEEEHSHTHLREHASDRVLAQALQHDNHNELTSNDAAFAAELARQEELEHLHASQPQERECTICTDEKHPLEFPAKPPSNLCTHRANTCTACLEQWVEQDLQTRGWQLVSCPECRSTLTHDDMRRASTPVVFARYDALAARGILGTLDNFFWCINQGCGSGQLHEGNEEGHNPEMTCGSCGFHQCVRHEIAWHAGESCAQYEYRTSGRQQQDHDSEQTIGRTTQRCPNERCGVRVEKKMGCDHMTCEFCSSSVVDSETTAAC